ncbi:hypothetical protein [Burkholderia cepacia]|uniref:hypothetical protein n=1 Tax=Burkholderia cepacia TaxID=292 RepID=UPI002FE1E132
MTTTDKNRADALKTIAEFPVTDPANMDALNMRKIAADAIAAPVEQHEAAPCDAQIRKIINELKLAQGDWSAGFEPDWGACVPDAIKMLHEILLFGHSGRIAGSSDDQHEAAPADGDSLTLSGAQLLEALEFIAPDRDAEQLESKVTIQRGTGHTGHGMYCWSTEYPEEGAILLDGTAIAQPAPSAPLEGTGNGADGRALYERLHTLMPEWYPDAWDDLLPKYRDAYATAALSRAPRTEVAGAVAEGWKLVPVEPTEGMKSAALRADDRWRQPGDQLLVQWDAMLAAAPPSPSADAAATCETCNGRGEVGGFQVTGFGEGGYDSQPCPDCSADAAAAPADERAKPGLIASTKTINAVSAALDAVREYANGRVADQMNRAVNMLLDELGQARAAASQPAAGQEAEPFGWAQPRGGNYFTRNKSSAERIGGLIPVYIAPPAQVATWQELTDGQRGVLTYVNQPDNVGAWRLGEACRAARAGGDPIDHGLSLLKELQDRGYGVIALLKGDKQ